MDVNRDHAGIEQQRTPEHQTNKALPPIPATNELPTANDHLKRHQEPLYLDYHSRHHLEELLVQCLQYASLKEELWKQAVFALVDDVVECITLDVLVKLRATREALQTCASQNGSTTPVIKSSVSNASLKSSDTSQSQDKEDNEDDYVDIPSNETQARSLLVQEGKSLPKLTRLVWTFKAHNCNASEPRLVKFEKDAFKGVLLLDRRSQESQDPIMTKLDPFLAAYEQNWDFYGGQFTLKAPHSEIPKLRQIIEVLLFATIHLLLEVQLYKDLGIVRPEPPPPEPPSKPRDGRRLSLQLLRSKTREDMPPELPPPIEGSTGHRKRASKGNAVWKFFRNRSDSNDSKPEDSKLKQKLLAYRDRSRTLVPAPEGEQSLVPTMTNRANVKSRKRRMFGAEDWEVIAPEPNYSPISAEGMPSPSSIVDDSALELTHTRESTASTVIAASLSHAHEGRIARVVDRMTSAKLSASPDVAQFPAPQLLKRLRDRESAPINPIHKKVQPQRPVTDISPASSTHADHHEDPHVISRDARAAMDYMHTNNNSVSGFVKHQAISLLHEQANAEGVICVQPRQITLPYYRFDMADAEILSDGYDMRLGEAVHRLTQKATNACNGCKQDHSTHVHRLSHSNVRINLAVKPAEGCAMPHEISSADVLQWFTCSKCGASTKQAMLSEPSKDLSFAKFLEIYIYFQKSFLNAELPGCEHEGSVSETRTLHFATTNNTLTLSLEPLNLFDVHFPTSLTDNLGNAEDMLSSATLPSVREDIIHFYTSTAQEVESLRNHVESDMSKSTALDAMLDSLSRHQDDLLARADRFSDALRLRSLFANCARLDMERLRIWQRKNLPDFSFNPVQTPACTYIDANTLALPDSHVVIKEKSPSTFLAYALTSSSYQEMYDKADDTLEQDASDATPLSSEPGSLDPQKEGSDDSSPKCDNGQLQVGKTSDTSGSRFLRAFNAAVSNDVDANSPGQAVDIDSMELQISVKRKKQRLHHASNPLSMRMVKKSKSSDAFSATSGSTIFSPGASFSSDNRKVSHDDLRSAKTSNHAQNALDQLVMCQTQEKKPSHNRSSGQLPGLISSLAKTSHQAEVSTTSALATPTRELDHSRAFSIGSKLSVASSNLTVEDPNAGEAGQSTTSSRSSRFLTSPLTSLFNLGRAPDDIGLLGNERHNRLHIKVSIKSNERRISITVWFAKEFEKLRRHCGILPADFIRAMEDSIPIHAEGGKSSAKFFTSLDKKYYLKELVPGNWAGLEKDSLLEFGNGGFFEHFIDSSAPSVLSKIFAFFTVKIKFKDVIVVRDVIVLENIFPDTDAISTKFDLKGISKRSAPGGDSAATLFDKEWTQNYRNQILLHPHCDTLLRQAIEADTKFLALSDIIDYSLLLGVDKKHREIVLGIIDILSAFSLGKMLESNAKRALNSGRKSDVTVLPPLEYAERFRNALQAAFLTVPDKWTRRASRDPTFLSSVL